MAIRTSTCHLDIYFKRFYALTLNHLCCNIIVYYQGFSDADTSDAVDPSYRPKESEISETSCSAMSGKSRLVSIILG